ncbi:MAG TPA: DMT family transporter [Candidatus Limnocylindria bacterium]|nr:DMT family transporter [Candidatus Limnocylindria bacterium]
MGGGPTFGLLSALSWGAGDFCGGVISRYASTFTAVMTAQVLGLIGTMLWLPFSGEAPLSGEAVTFAVLAGAFGVSGLFCFYYALGRGTMGVVAPIAALIGAGGPVLIAIYNGEHVSAFRLGGIILALIAVVLISMPGGESSSGEQGRVRLDLRELPIVILSGLGFAGFFVFIGHATVEGGVLWPLAVVRTVGVLMVLAGAAVLVRRMSEGSWRERLSKLIGAQRIRSWPGGRLALIGVFVGAALGDLGGNFFFVTAQHADLFSVAVVLSSLYPVTTTILAVVLLRERLRPLQTTGVVMATLSVVLLSNAFGA